MLCELNCKVEAHRKEQSIPGSGTLVTAEQGLFGKEQLQALNLNSKINREGKGILPKTGGLECSYSFRPLDASGSFKKFQSRFQGKGFQSFKGGKGSWR